MRACSLTLFILLATLTGRAVAQPPVTWSFAHPSPAIKLIPHPNGVLIVAQNGLVDLDGNGQAVTQNFTYAVTDAVLSDSGSYYTTGNLDTLGTSYPYVRKLNSQLQEVWLALIYPSISTAENRAGNVEVDGNKVLLAGSFTDSVLAASGCYAALFDTLGTGLWAYNFSGSPVSQEYAFLRKDRLGQHIIASTVDHLDSSSGNMAYRRLDSTGAFLCDVNFDALSARDIISDLAVNDNNAVYLTGAYNLTNAIGNTVSALSLFDPSCNLSTFGGFDGFMYDEKQHVLYDPALGVYASVTGTDYQANSRSHIDLLRVNPSTLQILWQQRHDSVLTIYEIGQGIALKSNADVMAFGSFRTDPALPKEGFVLCYDSSGTYKYEWTFPLPGQDLEFIDWKILEDTCYLALGTVVDSLGDTTSLVMSLCDGITGMSQEAAARTSTFSLYPNPASQYVTWKTTHTIRELTVFESSGRVVGKYTINERDTRIDVSGWPAGVYIVRWSDGSAYGYSRLIKSRD